MIAQSLINEGDEAIMASPSFSLYEICVNHMGGKSIKIPLKDNFEHDFEGFVDAITPKTKIIFVCNPNNPTGNIMPKERIDWLLANVPDHVVVMLDEAYYEYAIRNADYPESLDILEKRPNTIILRTLSKVAGLAGIRVGYAISNAEMVGEMTKVKGVFNVNRLAQVAAIAALNDDDHIVKQLTLIMTHYKRSLISVMLGVSDMYHQMLTLYLWTHNQTQKLCLRNYYNVVLSCARASYGDMNHGLA